MRGSVRILMGTVAAAALTVPIAASSEAGAVSGPAAVSVNITGGDHFLGPNLFSNDFRFPNIVVRQGGTITWHNLTDEGHTMALVPLASVPRTTAQVDNCAVCNAVNAAFGLNGSGPPAGAQIENGVVGANPVDAPDTGAIASAKGPLPPQSAFPILIDHFNVPNRNNTASGDAVLVDTAGPQGNGFPVQRTVVVTAGPGRYHYICTLHPWMQGSIDVTG